MRKRLNVRPCRFTAVTGLRATVMTAAAALGLSAAAVAPAEAATVKVTSHFVWVATSANNAGDSTFINNGATNGRPGDLLFITPNLTPGGINPCFPAVCLLTPLSPVGVWYSNKYKQWTIFNEDASDMGSLFAYNVLVVPKSSRSAFVHEATTSNTSGNRTLLNSRLLNGKPTALVLITQNRNPNGAGGIADNHPAGVRYYKSLKRWGIFNEGGGAMPLGAAFNVLVGQGASNGGKMTVLKATGSNRVGSSVLINNAETNANPNNVTFVTQDFNPGGKGGTADKYPVQVAYFGTRENVLNWAGTKQKVGTAYNVLIFSS